MKAPRVCALALAFLLLASCGEAAQPTPAPTAVPTPTPTAAPTPAPTPTPEPTPELKYINPLTGEGCAEDISHKRPIAIMLNNLKKALPQHGVAKADIIYEVPAEGGITRMLAVFQSVDEVGKLGSVRSARPYYVELAEGHDAVFLHAGGSDGAYAAIKGRGVTALDCVNGPYEGTLYWRDKDRIKNAGLEHSVFTSGETINRLFEGYSFRKDHKDGYAYEMSFAEDGTPANGTDAQKVSVQVSYNKYTGFIYDEKTGMYLVEEYGAPYVDGNLDEQVAVTNVLVLKTAISNIPGDTAGRLEVALVGSGAGCFACGGKLIDIRWSKDAYSGQLSYATADGQPLTLGVGSSYVAIISTDSEVIVE